MDEPKYLPILIFLLKKGAHSSPVKISTTELASELECSQQSVSRWLIDLEREGYLTRTSAGIALSKRTIEELRAIHSSLSAALQPKGPLTLSGKIFKGLGEGRYYMSVDGYRKAFKAKLGFTPYAGTLNMRLSDPALRAPVDFFNGIRVEGFKSENRFFGGLTAYKVVINDKFRGALIVPDRTHYGRDVLELISDKNLRQALKLEDGDEVRVRILSE